MAEEAPTDHIQRIVDLSRPGQPLTADAPTATINNPDWFRRIPGRDKPIPTPERAELHKQLRAQVREAAPEVERERKAVVLAGPPGAGKTDVRKSVLGDDDTKYLGIDADEFKAALLNHALRDGSYENSIKPDAIKTLESQTGEKFYPMELASLVHEESSMLARTMRTEAIQRGDNIVLDTVLSSEHGAREIGAQLESAGYDVQVIDVEVPYEVSQDRIQQRWFQARQQAEANPERLGGRWVPSEYARDVFNGPDGKTKSEHSAQQLAESCPAVSRYRVYRTTAEQAQVGGRVVPTVEADKSRIARGAADLIDTKLAETRQRIHTARPGAQHTTRAPDRGYGRD